MPEFTLTDFAHRKWGHARTNKLEFAQVYCKSGSSHSRASAVIEAFSAAAAADQEHGKVKISYLLHCDADVSSAESRYKETVDAFAGTGNTFTFTTFASWKDGDAGDRQILLLDTNQHTTTSTDTLEMLDITQTLGSRAKEEGLQCLVVLVSGHIDPLVWRDRVSGVHTFTLEGTELPQIRHNEKSWRFSMANLVTDRLKRRLEEIDGAKEEEMQVLGEDHQYGPTLVLFMRDCDAAEVFHCAQIFCPHVEFDSIMPWSSSGEIRQATRRSPWLKLLHVDDGVTVMPLIEHSEVLIGPKGNVFLFDSDIHCTTAVPDATVNIDGRLQAAFSLSYPPPAVHTFQPGGQSMLYGPSPAFGPQLPHLWLSCIHGCEDRHPIDLPIKFPDDRIMLFEAVRRLGAWGLIHCNEGEEVQQIKQPLASQPFIFSRCTSNINAAVLLGCISEGMSNAAANVLVDMAVMVCQGPSSIFSLATADAKTETVGHIGSLDQRLINFVHKGQLWLSLACLNAFRTHHFSSRLCSLLRREVLGHAVSRASNIKSTLNIPEADVKDELTDIDVQAVEESLARSFLFNIVLTDMSESYRAVDLVSRVELIKHENDALDWDKLGGDSDTPGVVAGVYTYLDTNRDDDTAEIVYQARDVTTIPLKTVLEALSEVSGVESLRPLWGPKKARCMKLDNVDRYFKDSKIADKDSAAGQQDDPAQDLTEQDGGLRQTPVAAVEVRGTQDSGGGVQDISQKFPTKFMLLPPARMKFMTSDR